MDLDDVAALTSSEGRALLAGLPGYDERSTLALAERLRSEGHPAGLVAAALTQQRLRAKARGRLGPVVDRLLLTPDGAEQVTRPAVAAHRAARYRRVGLTHVADLGAGIGGDALALAAAGLRVRAVEQDPVTAAVLAANAAALGHPVEVVVAAMAVEHLAGCDAAFADPARRVGGRRVLDPLRWQPPLPWVLDLPVDALGVKVAPGIDHAWATPGVELDWVSMDGDLVEAALYRGPLATPGVSRRATLLPAGASLTDAELPTGPPPVGPVGAVLYEPDDAVLRAGLVAAAALRVGGRLVDPTIAYVTADEVPAGPDPFLTGYAVDAVLPFQLKRLRAALRERGVGRVVVKKRGSAVDPDELRRRLRLDGDAELTVLLTRVAGEPTAILARPLSR